MIGANQYELTWSHFEQLHEDKKIAFENLCRSLFKKELCQKETILHSDHNHPGVEVAPVLAKDGTTKISFQAKHFDNKIKYVQIERSIDETIRYYSGILDIIYLYCNKDIMETSASYKRIKRKLVDAGIRIELITGQTVLEQAMNYPPILSCYFGLDSLDNEWFKRNIKISLENLGKRYNSIFNIDTETQKNMSLFLREDIGVSELNAKKNDLISNIKNLRWRCNGKYNSEINFLLKKARNLENVDKKTFNKALNWKTCFENDCNEIFENLRNNLVVIEQSIHKYSYKDSAYEKLKNDELEIERILSVSSSLAFSKIETTMINCRIAIVTGEMGTGKSQLLATAAKRMIENERPALLLLGQTFIADDSIENQIIQNLEGLSFGQNFESLISVMDAKGELLGEDAVIFIDAINESTNREIWKNGINRIITTLTQYNHVKLVISLRSGYEQLTLSQSVLDKKNKGNIAEIRHTGFADESPTKIYEFLSNYEIPFSPEYYLRSEMTNPLFLTWFCNTYSGEEQGLFKLIDKVLKQADQEGSKSAGAVEAVGMLMPLIYEMLDISESGILGKRALLELPVWNIYGVSNKIGYLKAIERAGVLTSFVHEQEENYYIGYNLLEDYLKASRIVDRKQSKDKIIEYCERVLFNIDNEGNIKNYGNESVFVMVASLYAIKHEEELIEVIDKVNHWNKERLLNEYFMSFIWRSSYITYDKFLGLINKYPVDSRTIWNVFIENSVKKKSELNALGLTKLLNRYSINRRDYIWTMDINELDENNRLVSLAYYIEAGNVLDGLNDDEAFLLLVTFSWMLSASNRNLRDRVSKAMIEILKEHFEICKQLLEMFKDVNDPYIIQRLYGIVFGAVMKRTDAKQIVFKDLAQWIYKEIFDKSMVYPDILLRDYARLIIERFIEEYPDDLEGIIIEKIKPPYQSEPIPIVKEIDYEADKYQDEGLWPLLYSMKFDLNVKGIGLYGDFGRYVFQAALSEFVDVNMENIYYYAIQYILGDLGYNPEYFAEYDKHRNNYARHHVKKSERIGKKYQWIAMYNILARISDTHNIRSQDRNDKIGIAYEGPWKPYVRDFDPTLNTKICSKMGIPHIKLPQYGEDEFCDMDASDEVIDEWVIKDDKMFKNFPERLVNKDELGREWVSIYLDQENKLCPREAEYFGGGYPAGEQHVWTIAAMYISMEATIKERDLIKTEFIKQNHSGMVNCCSLFAREYTWSPGYKAEFGKDGYENDESSIKYFPAAINFLWEEEYDASQENATSFVIPAGKIIQEMKLQQKKMDGVYYYGEEVVALDLSILDNDNTELVIRRDVLDEYIKRIGGQVFWTVVGEKQYFLGNMNQKWQRREGYFIYENNRITGNICVVDNF